MESHSKYVIWFEILSTKKIFRNGNGVEKIGPI